MWRTKSDNGDAYQSFSSGLPVAGCPAGGKMTPVEARLQPLHRPFAPEEDSR